MLFQFLRAYYNEQQEHIKYSMYTVTQILNPIKHYKVKTISYSIVLPFARLTMHFPLSSVVSPLANTSLT